MQTTLESPVVIAAKEMLEDIKHGRRRSVKLGSQKPASSSLPKKNFKKIVTPALSIILVVVTLITAIEYSKCTVTGFSAINGEGVLPNANLEFHNMNSNEVYYVKSSKEGDFKLRLPQGTYKICSKDFGIQSYHQSPETSPTRVKIEDDKNIRVGLNALKK